MTLLQSIVSEGYKLDIYQDDWADSPRDWDNLGTMITWTRDYLSPDKNEFKTPEDFLEWWSEQSGVLLPVFMFNHSGVKFSTTPFNDRWDSGQVGFIYATEEKMNDLMYYWRSELSSATEEDIRGILKNEVDNYSDYAEGNVYRYDLWKAKTCEHCQHVEWLDVESCGGYLGGIDEDCIPVSMRGDVHSWLVSK